MYAKALDLFEQMPLDPNESTLTIIFNACAQLSDDRAKEIGKKLLKQITKDCPNTNMLLTSAMYMLLKFGDVKSAEDLFGSMMNKDIVTFNAMMIGKF